MLSPPLPRRLLALAGVVAIALGVGAWLLGRQLLSSSPPPHLAGAAHGAARRAASPAATLVPYEDSERTFVAAYPSNWRLVSSSGNGLVLLATGPGGASLLVREAPLHGQVTAANLGAGRRLADRAVNSGQQVRQLRAPQRVTLGGLPGYLYLYTFYDPQSGERGAHAHYFLFDGETLITLVFQALPASDIFSLAPEFDRIAATFRALHR